MPQSAPMSLAKLINMLYGTFTGTSTIVVSFAFKDPGSGIVPDAISLHHPTKKKKF